MGLDIDFAKLSPQEVLDLAVGAEEEAEEHYEGLADAMERSGNLDVAAFFRKMAGREKLHHDQLAERRQALFGDARPRLGTNILWGVEVAAEGGVGAAMTVKDALTVARQAEINAHDYYAAAQEYLTDASVVAMIEELLQVGQQSFDQLFDGLRLGAAWDKAGYETELF